MDERSQGLSITVSEEMARLIRDRIADGSYASPSEVIDAALGALMRQEDDFAGRLAAIKARIKASIEDPRPPLTGEQVRTRLKSLAAKLSNDPAA